MGDSFQCCNQFLYFRNFNLIGRLGAGGQGVIEQTPHIIALAFLLQLDRDSRRTLAAVGEGDQPPPVQWPGFRAIGQRGHRFQQRRNCCTEQKRRTDAHRLE